MIITLTNTKINRENINNVYRLTFVEEEMLMTLSSAGLFFNQYKEYEITYDSLEFKILCPILYINGQKVTLHPAIKLPRRKYPCYVYIYAVIKYITSDLNMRQVAKEIRFKFGLDNFSAATVCRSVNKFIEIKDRIENNCSHEVEQIKLNPRITFCKKLNKKIAYRLLSSLKVVLDNPITFTTQLVYKYFCKTTRFLF